MGKPIKSNGTYDGRTKEGHQSKGITIGQKPLKRN